MIGFSLKLLVRKTTSDWICGDGKGVLSKTCEQVVFPEVEFGISNGLDTTEGCKNEVVHLVVLRHSSHGIVCCFSTGLRCFTRVNAPAQSRACPGSLLAAPFF